MASSLRASQEAIVLLQNNASLLPLFPNPAGRNVALIGAIANETSIMAGGKSDYHPSSVVSLYDGLVAHGAAVSYAKGCDVTGSDKSGFKGKPPQRHNVWYLVPLLAVFRRGPSRA